MAMTVANNNAAALVLGELNKNTNKLAKDLKKVSTGTKITEAADGASEYVQSEKLRTLVRALGQDIDNSQKGINMVKTAEGGIQGIIDSLKTMKELALNSLNDHNSDEDRKILQKEFSSRMAEIEEVASTTNYNGIILLDGRWRQMAGAGESATYTKTETVIEYETVTEPYTETITTYEEKEEEYTETVTTYEEVTEEYPYTYTKTTEKPLESHAIRPTEAVPTGVSEPGVIVVAGNPIEVKNVIPVKSNYTITNNGAYMIPEDYTGELHITAKNVKLVRQNNAKPLYDVYIDTSASGNTNLWLEDLDLRYIQKVPTDSEGNPLPYVFDQSFIKFQGNNNVLSIKGNNKITIGESEKGASGITYEKAFINVGDGITIEGSGTLEFKEGGLPYGAIKGALIGSDYNETSTADITINSGNIITSSVTSSEWPYPYGRLNGAVIGSGVNGTIGNIAINGGTFDLLVSGGGACIGGGQCSITGNITIQDAVIKARCDDGACIGSGSAETYLTDVNDSGDLYWMSSTGYVYILNSDLDLQNTKLGSSWENPSGTGAAIGGGGTYNGTRTYVGDITVENSTIKAVTDRGAGIGTGGDSESGGIGEPNAKGISIIGSSLDITVNDSRAEKIGKGVNGIIPVDTVEEEVTEMRTRTVTVPHEETVTKTRTVLVPHEETVTSTRTYTIPHEVTKTVEYQEDYEFVRNPLVIHTGPKANQHLRLHINDMRTKAMGLEEAAVDPLEKAREALEKLDSAVEYALNENVRMGAYQVRLAETIDNLIIAQENAIHSESVIRDSDMAKEMMNYTKDNILGQAAQAMLAQANQSASSVLGLLG